MGRHPGEKQCLLQEALHPGHSSHDTGKGGGFALPFSMALGSQLAVKLRALGEFYLAI